MSDEDLRRATRAAIERTARKRLSKFAAEDAVTTTQPAVEWEVGRARFCAFPRDDEPDHLHVYGRDGVAGFELELSELRENLADCGALDEDVDVIADERGWFPTAEPFRADWKPPQSEVARLRSAAPFEYLGTYERPGVRAVVQDLRERYRIGTAVAGEFGLGDDDVLRDLWEREGLCTQCDDLHLGVAFLCSDAVETFLREATPEEHVGDPSFREEWREWGGGFAPTEIPELPRSFSPVETTRLDGIVAETLLMGGAYEEFEGDREEAMALGRAFAHAFTDGKHTLQQTAYVSRGQWSNWFVCTDHWDVTVVLEDHETDRIRLFAATCSD